MSAQFVDRSGHIVSIRYQAEPRQLVVEFKNGSRYQYADVGPFEYLQLVQHKSPGTYLHAVIIPKHRATKL